MKRICPSCNSEMQLKSNRQQTGVDALFLACSGYPKCRRTVPFKTAVAQAISHLKFPDDWTVTQRNSIQAARANNAELELDEAQSPQNLREAEEVATIAKAYGWKGEFTKRYSGGFQGMTTWLELDRLETAIIGKHLEYAIAKHPDPALSTGVGKRLLQDEQRRAWELVYLMNSGTIGWYEWERM